MARWSFLSHALFFGDTTQRAVFAERLANVVHKISGRYLGRCRDDGPVVACSAQLVLRALEKLETYPI